MHYGLTSAAFSQLFRENRRDGYRPLDVSGYTTGQGVLYAAVWVREDGPERTERRNISRAGMQELVDTIGRDGWVPGCVEGYARGGESHEPDRPEPTRPIERPSESPPG